jgi:hypothetical protein
MSSGKVMVARTIRTEAVPAAQGGHLTSDLVLVHKVFRREFRLLPALVAGVAPGDCARAGALSAHCRELTTALRHFQAAERELLWPRLNARAVLDTAAAGRMADGHRHQAALMSELDGLLPLWEQDAAVDLRAVLTDILIELAAAVVDHLDAAEQWVLPAVDGHFTSAEWLTLGLRAASWIPLHRMAWMLGALLEDATSAERKNLMGRVPSPARVLFRMVGQERYTREMLALRAGPGQLD